MLLKLFNSTIIKILDWHSPHYYALWIKTKACESAMQVIEMKWLQIELRLRLLSKVIRLAKQS